MAKLDSRLRRLEGLVGDPGPFSHLTDDELALESFKCSWQILGRRPSETDLIEHCRQAAVEFGEPWLARNAEALARKTMEVVERRGASCGY